MRGHYAVSSVDNSIAVIAERYVVPDGSSGGLLHGDALTLSAFSQSKLLLISEPEGHGHDVMVSL